MESTELNKLEQHLGLTLKVMEIDWDDYKRSYGFTYDNEEDEAADRRYFNWHHFRGVHDPQSCMLDEDGHVHGIILRGIVTVASLELPELPALEYVCVCDNEKLTTFRMSGVFPLLQHLELSNNNLITFELTEPQPLLKNFNIRKNQLTTLDLPAELPALESLDATDNALTSLVLRGELPALKYLELSNNQLEHIESESSFSQLRKLNLRGNKLKKLPKGQYEKLETLYVSDNPLRNYEEVLIKGNDKGGNAIEIIADLRAMARGKRSNERLKLIVVGNGRVGKTSLVKRLSKLPFDPEEIYTHGIAITELNKAHFPGVKTDGLQLKVWDFGGQEVFYATHQFFMSEEAVYLYVWTDKELASNNRCKDKKQSPVDERWRPHQYWLDNIRMHGEKSPIVVVKTHAKHTSEGFPDGLAVEYEIKDGILNFDSDEELTERLDVIRRVLTKRINDVQLLGSVRSVSFYNIINTITELRKNGQYELTLARFTDYVLEEGMPQKDVKAVLSFLHKVGEVIYLEDKEVLKNKIFIDPNELIHRVYKLIKSNEELKSMDGRFDANYSARVLGADWEELLALLEGFELIYCNRTREPAIYIAPQYLPRLTDRLITEQNLFNHHKDSNPIKFSLWYPLFMPDNIMINLLSKYGPFGRDTVYRDNILFTDEATSEKCIICADEENRKIHVHLGDSVAANLLAKDVYEKLINLSKKAEVYVATTLDKWVKQSVLSKKNTDVFPLADGSGITSAKGFEFLWKSREDGFQFPSGSKDDDNNVTPKPTNKIPRVYFSYAWGDDETPAGKLRAEAVDALYQELKTMEDRGELKIMIDREQIRYKSSIRKFTSEYGDTSVLIVLIISEKYLKSEYCMGEVVEVLSNNGYSERIFPVVLPDVPLNDVVKIMDYHLFWEERKRQISTRFDQIEDKSKVVAFNEKLADIDKILSIFANFTTAMGDLRTVSPPDYRSLLDALRKKISDM